MWLAVPAFAHNPDTSYARIAITNDRVAFRLTYDLFTLQKITRLDVDNDRAISREELAAQTGRIASFLREKLTVEINLHPSDLGELRGFVWPRDATGPIPEQDYHSVLGLIHFDFVKPVDDTPEDVGVTFGFFPELGERHSVLGVFTHAGREEEVTFTRFEPDYLYDTGYQPPLAKRLGKFLKLGVAHIFLGYDHIAFLLALILAVPFGGKAFDPDGRLGLIELLKTVTAFTIAHSLTLILAALELVSLPTRLVEAGIAATIVYVAVENLVSKSPAHRWRLTFAFGLVHGFGFAGVLRELGLPTEGLVRCLLSFNVGVEAGQVAIVLAALPVALWLGRWKHGARAKTVLAVLIGLFGTAWLVERAGGWSFMPF